MLHVYTGDGKGKTTAAVGLAVRYCGSGKKVCVFQFLKDGTSSELLALQKIGVSVVPCQTETKGFFWSMNDDEKEKLKEETCKNFCKAKECINEFDMIVLDELAGAISNEQVNVKDVIEFLTIYAQKKEIVITGRNLPEEIIKMADYVSEIICVRHPFDCGGASRKGIEY